jgi:hypothetical protein
MRKIMLCLLVMAQCYLVNAQSFAINTDGSTANASALVDIKSTDKGMLIPRMSKAQKNAITTPATGLMVFQDAPDSIGFYYYNGTGWLWLATASATTGWSTTGNAGTDTAIHFIGTTDNMPLRFKQNNGWVGQFDTNKENVFFGGATGQNNTTGIRNTAIGDSALAAQSYNPGGNYLSDNTAIGSKALRFNQPTTAVNGIKNVAIGNEAMYFNTIGDQNVAIGVSALRGNLNGSGNVAVGRSANRFAKRGIRNSYLGYETGYLDSTGNYNTGMGVFAFFGHQTGDYNVAIGAFALINDSSGTSNVGLGTSTLRSNVAGNNATAIGTNAMFYANNTTTPFTNTNVAVGFEALRGSTTASANTGLHNTAIGYQSLLNNTSGQINTATGVDGLYSNTTGVWNTTNGMHSMFSNTTGNFNSAYGAYALDNNITGSGNAVYGVNALIYNKAGNNATAFGTNAMYYANNTTTPFTNTNVAIGYDALRGSATPAANTGIHNTAIGYGTLINNTNGSRNISLGYATLFTNLTGDDNAALGYNALNLATGSQNTAVGSFSMEATTTGQYNTAVGYQSLTNNVGGSFNTSIGRGSLALTTAGNFNTALGYAAGNGFNNGSSNTFIGYNSDASAASFTNTTSIGNGAIVTASNRIRIGNTAVTQIGGEVGWSTLSDGRYKKNIQASSLGLRFILKLNPVTYNLTDKGQEAIKYTGLIAQDVEKILQEYDAGFNAVTKPENETDRYAIRYAEFVMPLINAVKEQQKQIDELKALVNKMKAGGVVH